MLVANYSIAHRNTGRSLGNAINGVMAEFKAPAFQNWYFGDHVVTGETSKSAWNNGYAVTEQGGSAWWLSPTAGGLMTNTVAGTGALTIGSLSLGKDLSSALSGSGTVATAIMVTVVQLASTCAGNGTISAATIQAISTFSAALSGSGSISAAALSLIVSVQADLTGSGTLTADEHAILNMAADIVVTGTGLTTANVGDAVWQTLLETGFTADQILRIIAAATAGKASGGPGSPVFRNLSDTQDQITGTADSSGNRSAATYGS
jgi:hypothetical protein